MSSYDFMKSDHNQSVHMRVKLTLLLLMTATWLSAQEGEGSQAFTLQQCIDYALENNVNAKNAKLDEEIAKARVKETVGIGLPQVSGTVTAQQSPTQQRFFTQYTAGGQSFFIDDATAAQLGMEDGDVAALENIFALKGNGDANLSINQIIFNGSYIVGLQASKAYKDLAVKQADQTKEDVILQVSKAFYNLLIVEERLDLVSSNMKRLDTLFRNTRAMQESGFAEQIDVDRIRVSLNNLKVGEQDLKNMKDISVKLLKFQMNYPFDKELVLNGELEDVALTEVMMPDEEIEYAQRPDYQVMLVNKELQQLNIKNKYAEAIPSISAFASLGYNTQSPDFGGIFSTEASFEGNDQIGPDKWYGYSAIGLRLNWNLFTGLQRNYQIQQEKLSLLKIENGLESMEQSIDMEIQRSKANLENAINKLDVQQESMDLASNIFDITQIKFEEGVGSNLEVVEADNDLKEAQTNYYSALYDAIIAQLELKKAIGTLYNQQ